MNVLASIAFMDSMMNVSEKKLRKVVDEKKLYNSLIPFHLVTTPRQRGLESGKHIIIIWHPGISLILFQIDYSLLD